MERLGSKAGIVVMAGKVLIFLCGSDPLVPWCLELTNQARWATWRGQSHEQSYFLRCPELILTQHEHMFADDFNARVCHHEVFESQVVLFRSHHCRSLAMILMLFQDGKPQVTRIPMVSTLQPDGKVCKFCATEPFAHGKQPGQRPKWTWSAVGTIPCVA